MSEGRRPTLDTPITRRDLVGATLVGAGAALLNGCGRTLSLANTDPATDWNGPGGVGEYRHSNGTTWDTVSAGHSVRDGTYADRVGVRDIGEHYDLVIVGGGFSGLGALHAFRKERPRSTCLLLDNQEVFGGYAKANEFEVDGYRIAGAQASLNFLLPRTPSDRGGALWRELGLPPELHHAGRKDGRTDIKFAASSSGPLYFGEQSASVGYFFSDHGWVRDIWRDDLTRAPWPEQTRRALITMRERRRAGPISEAEAARLDAMTFEEFATRELNATPDALKYITDGMCICGPQISAYGARSFPGLERFAVGSEEAALADRFMSFPEGNAVLARALVKAVLPEAIRPNPEGGNLGILERPVLDRDGSAVRLRNAATVVHVANEPHGGVAVTYVKAGQLFRVRADAAVLGIGAWVAKHIVADMPPGQRAALDRYLYAPMLMVNVALRNWRFLDRLGFSAARWFEGTGFYGSIRAPLLPLARRAAPFHPDKPIVMTLYVNFPRAPLPLEAQGPAARAELFATPYAEYERRIIDQLQAMFAPGGFDAARDIAGVVLNRWGHAFVTPPPGFYFASPGELAPAAALDRPVGRIAFARSEDWLGSVESGAAAMRQALASR